MAIPAAEHATATNSRSSRPALVVCVPELKNLILILTARCNSHCSYCYQTAKKALSMEWPTLRASIDLAFASTSKRVRLMFLGGEPLLEWPKIHEGVVYAHRNAPPGKEIRYGISTNGLLLTDPLAEFLARYGFDVQLSFDGVAEAQRYRGAAGFEVIDQLLDRLSKRHPDYFRTRLRVSVVVIPATIPFLAESIRYLIAKGVGNISLTPCYTGSSEWAPECISYMDDQFGRVYDDCLRHYQSTGEVPVRLFRKTSFGPYLSGSTRDMCNLAAGKVMAVDVDGQAYGCSLLAESYQEFPSEFLRSLVIPLRLGDVQDPRLWERLAALPEAARKAQIFTGKERKRSSYGACEQCRYLDECVVCPISIGHMPGNTDPHRIPDFNCAFNKIAGKYRDRFPRRPTPIEELEEWFRATESRAPQ